MSYTAKKLLEIAIAELGYQEKESNSQLDDKTANAGDGNYTKYARDLYAAGYYNGNKQGFPYCDVFHDWCHYMAAGKDAKLAQEVTCQTGSLGAGCKYSAQYYRNQGRFYTSDPHYGDQIFFGPSGDESHTGIVESVANGVITTVEGNTSNQVARCTYNVTDANISGYGRPKYDAEEAEEPVAYTTGKTNEETVFNFCKEVLGLNTAGALGVIVNVAKESNFDPTALGDGGTSFGICQWHASRYTNLKNWCGSNGKDYKTIDGQLWYLKYELEKSYSTVLSYIRSVANTAAGAYDAAYRWCLKFEIPANTEATSQARGALARDTYWPKYNGSSSTTTQPATPATGTSAAETVYTVVKGDTLSGIAQKHGTTWQALAAYNGIANPDLIYAGQQIKIPRTAVTVTEGSKVTIQNGAVYGGLATSRGMKVPDYVSGSSHRYTVKDVATHNGVEEALLQEINSWVAISYLTVV